MLTLKNGGCQFIQEDIKTAFEKLINPVVKNVTGLEWKRTFCEQTAYLSITTTDDQVHTYIASVMEVIHRLPKQLKWDSSKPKAQAITSGEETTTINQKKDKTKGKGKGPLFPMKEREKVEKVKERANQKVKAIMLVERPGIRELPLFP